MQATRKNKSTQTKLNLEAQEQIALLRRAGIEQENLVRAFLVATNLTDTLTLAENGDIQAAKDAVRLVSWFLDPPRKRGTEPEPLPPAVRGYLARAFLRISLGESADIALNLKRPKGGRPNVQHKYKLRVAYLVEQERREHGLSIEQASGKVADLVANNIASYKESYGILEAPDSKTVEGIFYKFSEVIAAIYRAAEDESTSKTQGGN